VFGHLRQRRFLATAQEHQDAELGHGQASSAMPAHFVSKGAHHERYDIDQDRSAPALADRLSTFRC
jgi:hypothetical protein